MTLDRKAALKIVKKVLTADFACEERHLDEEGVFICQAKELEGARRFPLPDKFLAMVTMGKGTVICCSAGRLRWARDNLSKLNRDDIFLPKTMASVEKYVRRDQQCLQGPALKYICSSDRFHPAAPPDEIKITLFNEEEIPGLYEDKRFPNSLSYGRFPQRPDMIAAVATCRGERVGMAAASADCDVMWQIGVDTLPGYRDRGIGKALVSVLTENLMKRKILPYYGTAISNIASRRTAITLGYFPAWVEMYSREIQRD